MLEIRVGEVVQAGDVFLVHFKCPTCRHYSFCSFPADECYKCGLDLRAAVFLTPKHRKFYRLLSGTKRKPVGINKKIVRTLLEIQGDFCAYCDKSFERAQFHVDHVIPLSFGGTNNLSNLVLACAKCNLAAGSKVFASMIHKRHYLAGRVLG